MSASACVRGVHTGPRRARSTHAGPSPRCVTWRAVPPRGVADIHRWCRTVTLIAATAGGDEGTSTPSVTDPASASMNDDDDDALIPPPQASTPPVEVDVTVPHADPTAQVWFIPNFLDEAAAAAVAKGCGKLRKRMKSDHSFATGRLSAMVPMASPVYAPFSKGVAIESIRRATGVDTLSLGDFPVETRLYRPGSEMTWHQDVKLYHTPQHELIYTVSNDGWDGATEWVGSDGLRMSIRAPSNSALVFAAGPKGAWHRVVGAGVGTRTIVKALYVEDFAKTEAFAEVMDEAPWRR